MRFINKIKKTLFGYDIFISYSRKDSLDYGYAIAAYFMKKGYECYIDQLSSISPGKKLPLNIKNAIKRSSSFVLIGSKESQLSKPILEEIELFLLNNKNKPLIPISIENNMNEKSIWYKNIKGLALINDSSKNLLSGAPDKDVFDRIHNALKFTKKAVRLRQISLLTLFVLLITTTIAFLYSKQKSNEAYSAKKEAKASVEEKNKAENQASIAKQKEKESLKKLNEANKQVEQVLVEKSEIIRLKEIADNKATQLNYKNETLRIRNNASDTLIHDPVLAFKIAKKAYKRESDSKNKELLLEAISSINFYYKNIIKDYQILDFKEPYILLKNVIEDHLAVYDMKSFIVKPMPINTDEAWIIPTKSSWRILCRELNSNKLQLWNNSLNIIGKTQQYKGYSVVQFINNYKVKIQYQKESIIWDLLTNKKSYINESQKNSPLFYGNYGTLATRRNETSAIYYKSGLALTNKEGIIIPESHTYVSFDPVFTRADWSPDEQYLALNYSRRKRLGIWSPDTTTFTWLDPDGWVINSYTWSQNGHFLAFAGRTENEVDVTVEILDADIPTKSRRVIFNGEIPIKHMTFLPGDKYLAIVNKEDAMSILDISTNEVIGKGKQANQIYSSKLGLYSSSTKDFKHWSSKPAPRVNWTFNSNSKRIYKPKGAVDKNSNWLAVPFTEKEKALHGVELRNPITGYKKILDSSPGHIHGIEFSKKGKWLALLNSENIRIWNTKSWNHYDFNLINNHRQFISLKIKKNLLYSEVVTNSNKFKIYYKIDLSGSEPKFIEYSTVENIKDEKLIKNQKEILKKVKGWKIKDLYKYRSHGFKEKKDWIIRYTCRDQALGANDCDVNFIPKDINWLIKTYDSLLCNPKHKINFIKK
ncbi:toll/interleukin-1 receptor domain-containing protein [Tenacibaculum agarivorans]|uniref:toll/interleukin-1 receptor domain-containing protein n=1 Tax=Tenacibaculum agarivorans TaxID=1908389 RepID=UPI00094B92D6|nr:toll/interleukin-1 receptor domain-containing protein [Tenacibaculum agarivorans]